MCGFAGILGGAPLQRERQLALLHSMGDAIRHRGPDDGGYWLDQNQRIGFAHRRLAIVDLSAAGHQPMASTNERFILAFNGEIYNHLALRRELDSLGWAQRWRGHSDTETLLAGFETWGIRATLDRLVGMFAIAVWDRDAGSLTLIREIGRAHV